MCAESQQLQYGNYVPKLFVVQLKVLLLCVFMRACGKRAVNTWKGESGAKNKGGGKVGPTRRMVDSGKERRGERVGG